MFICTCAGCLVSQEFIFDIYKRSVGRYLKIRFSSIDDSLSAIKIFILN